MSDGVPGFRGSRRQCSITSRRVVCDALDIERIAEAVQRPTMKFVATKSADQLDLQALHQGARTAGGPAHRHHQPDSRLPVGARSGGAPRAAIPAPGIAQRTRADILANEIEKVKKLILDALK
jgi:hypothetical protein